MGENYTCVWCIEGVAPWECCVCVRVVCMCIWDCVRMLWGFRCERGYECVWGWGCVDGSCVCVCLAIGRHRWVH